MTFHPQDLTDVALVREKRVVNEEDLDRRNADDTVLERKTMIVMIAEKNLEIGSVKDLVPEIGMKNINFIS